MKTLSLTGFLMLITIYPNLLAQDPARDFLDAYNLNQEIHGKKSKDLSNIKGSPYFTDEFTDAEVYLKDKRAFKLPLRYNIYNNSMEYQIKDDVLEIGNPESIDKIIQGTRVFVYLPFIEKGGYFELLSSGRCFLALKRSVKFKPAEPLMPYQDPKPDRFEAGNDQLYLITNDNQINEIKNLKTLLNVLNDKKSLLESFMKKEKIKNPKQENVVKLINYYNSL